MSTIDDKIPGANWKVPLNSDNLKFAADQAEKAVYDTRKLMAGSFTSLASPGIVTDTDPASLTSGETSEPLFVQLDPDNQAQVIIYPGSAVNSLNQLIEISEQQTVDVRTPGTVGSQTVVYVQYGNQETTPVPTRTRIGDVKSRFEVNAEEDMCFSSTLSAYEALSEETKKRTVVIGLVTVQEQSDGSTLPVVDLSQGTLSYNRPWYSVVDVSHRSMVGTGSSTSKNPHGISLNEVSVAGDLSLYHALIGRGILICPANSLPGVPGTLCEEEIPGSRWQVDTTGDITGLANSQYVELLGYPIALGACYVVDGNEDTDQVDLLAPELITNRTSIGFPTRGRSNIIAVGPNVTIDSGETYRLRYTCASILEPPAAYDSDQTLTFGSPKGQEVVISDGLAFNTVEDPELSTEGLGTIPRNIWAVFDDDLGLVHVPQVLVPFTRLRDLSSDLITISATPYGGGRIRVWMTDAIANASLEVSMSIQGTDESGGLITETITFDDTWVDNPAPSDVEEPAQCIVLDSTFANADQITISTRNNDGPNTAILVEMIPDSVTTSGNFNHPFLVSSIFWDGYRAARLTDEREVTISLHKQGRPRAEAIGEAVLTTHALNPEVGSNIVLIASEDADQMLHSDMLLTQRWALRGDKGMEDPALPASSTSGRNSYYYSRALRAANEGTVWISVTLLGMARHFNTGDTAEYRVARSSDPNTWTDWRSFDTADITRVGNQANISSFPITFYSYLPEAIGGFASDDEVYKFQFRFLGDWSSYVVLLADADLREGAGDSAGLLNLNTAFKVEHYEYGAGASLRGLHRKVTVEPPSAGAGLLAPDTEYRVHLKAHASGDGYGHPMVVIDGQDPLGAPLDGTITLLNSGYIIASGGIIAGANGSLSTPGGSLSAAGVFTGTSASISGTTTSAIFAYAAEMNAIEVLSLAEFRAVIDQADGDLVQDWNWTKASVAFPGAAPDFFGPTSISSGSYICVPLDGSIRHGTKLRSIALWVQREAAGAALTLTLRLQRADITGSGTTWTNVASGSESIPIAAGRQVFEVSMGDPIADVQNNLYRLRIEADANVNAMIAQIGLLWREDDTAAQLNKFP